MKKRKFIGTFLAVTMSIFTLVSCGGGRESSSSSASNSSSSTGGTEWTGKLANGVKDLTGLTSDQKTELAGQIEKYAMYHHLTGIPLYGDGGYSLLSDRVTVPTGEYVTNYGFGTLREGKITRAMSSTQEANVDHQWYLHSGTSTAPSGDLNPFNAANTSSSAMLGYISGSFYSQRLKKDGKGGYLSEWEWYSQLAKEMPIAGADFNESTNSGKTWIIKLRTGDDGLKYRTASTAKINGVDISSYNNQGVTLDDYVFAYKALFNGKNAYAYAAQFISGSTAIKGVADYYQNTLDVQLGTTKCNNEWDNNVGITKVDTDGDGKEDALQIEFVYPQSQFNAMMNVQTVATPVPESFFKAVTNDYADPLNYGAKTSTGGYTPVDTYLSCGPYVLTKYEAGTGTDGEILFERNNDWFERTEENSDLYEIYSIPGVKYLIRTQYGQTDGAYNDFLDDKLDSAGIPSKYVDEWNSKTNDGKGHTKYKVDTSAVWALQINSTTEERHEEIFGQEGYIWKLPTTSDKYSTSYKWNVKPIMSNDNFLNGVYLSIDRQQLAESLGNDLGWSYFADNVVANMDTNTTYNSTEAHANAMANWYPNTYSYNKDAASQLFLRAVEELQSQGYYTGGTASNPVTISVRIEYQLSTQTNQEGAIIKNYIESAFNTSSVLAKGVKLEIENYVDSDQSNGGVYNHIKRGMFDFGFGTISGSAYNLFEKFSLLLDNNETGLTLSWGDDTNVVYTDSTSPKIVWDGEAYSLQAIYDAVTYGDREIVDGCVKQD